MTVAFKSPTQVVPTQQRHRRQFILSCAGGAVVGACLVLALAAFGLVDLLGHFTAGLSRQDQVNRALAQLRAADPARFNDLENMARLMRVNAEPLAACRAEANAAKEDQSCTIIMPFNQ